MSYVLLNEAERDLREILHYTEETWGRKQRRSYSKMLEDAFVMLALQPSRGRRCDEIRPDYLKYHAGKHYIFYRQMGPKHIEIVRVLHERMNIEMHIS